MVVRGREGKSGVIYVAIVLVLVVIAIGAWFLVKAPDIDSIVGECESNVVEGESALYCSEFKMIMINGSEQYVTCNYDPVVANIDNKIACEKGPDLAAKFECADRYGVELLEDGSLPQQGLGGVDPNELKRDRTLYNGLICEDLLTGRQSDGVVDEVNVSDGNVSSDKGKKN